MTQFIRPTKDELIHDAEIFKKIKFGDTKPSPEDPRDFHATFAQMPLLSQFPDEYEAPEIEILNQGEIGSCVAHACCTTMSENEQIHYGTHNQYSPGFLYGNRAEEDYPFEGMIVREALKSLQKRGIVLQEDFPYNDKYPTVKALIEERAEELAEKAAKNKILGYYKCDNEVEIKRTIVNFGAALICIPVYTDFGRDLHKTNTNRLVGYHAMAIIGWTKDDKWIVQNSWGYFWGYSGKLLMDKDYPLDEVWGIVLKDKPNPNPPVDDKKSFIQKLIEFIIKVFKQLFGKKQK